jgi:hypothetical protein
MPIIDENESATIAGATAVDKQAEELIPEVDFTLKDGDAYKFDLTREDHRKTAVLDAANRATWGIRHGNPAAAMREFKHGLQRVIDALDRSGH